MLSIRLKFEISKTKKYVESKKILRREQEVLGYKNCGSGT